MTKSGYVRTDVSGASDQQDAVDWSVLESLAVLQKPGAPDLRTRLITIYLKTSLELMKGTTTAFLTADAQLLATSAHAMDGDRELCLAAGMDDYLAKPFNPGQIVAVLQKWAKSEG